MVDVTSDHVHKVKLIIVGDISVGKSSLALRFTRGHFKQEVKATIAAAFFSRTLETNGEKVLFQIWDTAGQERYRSLLPMYIRGAEAAVIVYDITKKESFDNVWYWHQLLKDTSSQDMRFVLVGNKIDLDELREVSSEHAHAVAEDRHMSLFEASSKTGENIDEIFYDLAKSIVSDSNKKPGTRDSIKLDSSIFEQTHRQHKCCKS